MESEKHFQNFMEEWLIQLVECMMFPDNLSWEVPFLVNKGVKIQSSDQKKPQFDHIKVWVLFFTPPPWHTC